MAIFLLDTSVFTELARASPRRKVLAKYQQYAQRLITAAPVIHELWFGVERLPRSERRDNLERFLREVVSSIPCLPYGRRAARWHARERARLAAAGRTPPFVDGQIASIAAVNEATIVTANVDHFALFSGVAVENWFR